MKNNLRALAERARVVASQVGDTASTAGSVVGEKTRDAASVVGRGVGESLNEEALQSVATQVKGAALAAGSRAADISRKLSESDTAKGGKALLNRARDAVGENHAEIADHVDTAAKATKVAAGAAFVGAAVAAPTGLTAVGVSLGVISAPAIMTVAPILVGAAGAAFTVSAGASLYSKYKSRTESGEAARDDAEQTNRLGPDGSGGPES